MTETKWREATIDFTLTLTSGLWFMVKISFILLAFALALAFMVGGPLLWPSILHGEVGLSAAGVIAWAWAISSTVVWALIVGSDIREHGS